MFKSKKLSSNYSLIFFITVMYLFTFQSTVHSTNTIKSENSEANTNDTKKTVKLYIKTKPENSTIIILNIEPKFYQGIELNTSGKYHVEVSGKGHKTHRQWIEFKEIEEKSISIVLKMDECECTLTRTLFGYNLNEEFIGEDGFEFVSEKDNHKTYKKESGSGNFRKFFNIGTEDDKIVSLMQTSKEDPEMKELMNSIIINCEKYLTLLISKEEGGLNKFIGKFQDGKTEITINRLGMLASQIFISVDSDY